MSTFTRNLNFSTANLGKSATLLLTFDDKDMKGIYQDYFPTAWRVTTFAATGNYTMTATYQNKLAFIKSQVQGDIVVNASTWVDIDSNQSTNLTEAGGVYSFSPPVPADGGSAKTLKAVNKTSAKQDIGLGFDNGKGSKAPAAVLLFPEVGVDYTCTVQFKPILSAYIVSDYQENQILRGAIQSPKIWSVDLASLNDNTSFVLSWDSNTGRFSINKE